MTDFSDMTLEELRLALAPEVAAAAIFDGWNDTALEAAAEMAGVDFDVAKLAYAEKAVGGRAMDMIDAWIENVDAQMEQALPQEKLAEMKIRDRIFELVWFRLMAIEGLEEALRRATAIMAMPHNAPRSLQIGWRSADLMWRLAGDTATDYNHYTKRTILGSIYAATLAVFVDDDSEGKAQTRAFLERRIEGVMKFEKVKAKWTRSDRESFQFMRFLGRLRYPAR